ncbi:peroxidase family protein [Arthrobacter crystallopoietes]|uniref:peroxidase family protein n=1 Tax=Crystallibacter crystallopoietes TaxID=37928 RepID=UPI003D26036E
MFTHRTKGKRADARGRRVSDRDSSRPDTGRKNSRAGSRGVASALALVLTTSLGLPALAGPAHAVVGQGFTVTPADLAFILKQIKISEAHVANTTSATGPCGALLGNGANQVPGALVSYGLRTVDGTCNNLQQDRQDYGAANKAFPRLTEPQFRTAEDSQSPRVQASADPGYAAKTDVWDSQPRVISNLIVDQTSTNPAAVDAAAFPVRSQGGESIVPCTTQPTETEPGAPEGCVPAGETLFIPNITTDVGLSPPYNGLFTLFGQFFDHGLDLVSKSGGTVYVPLKDDDPLIPGRDGQLGTADDLPPQLRFMAVTRATNQPGPDGQMGTADDIQEATNRTNPYVDQSQTYASHPAHQVFLRTYTANTEGKPVSTGELLTSADGGMGTWELLKKQAAERLGLRLVDADVLGIPMILTDPYGKFVPGPERGLPQYVTPTGLVEGNLADPVPAPANVERVSEAFLDDIAHNAAPNPGLAPDPDTTFTPATARQAAGTYDDEMLNRHFVAGDGRVNENIGLSMIHQIFHSEHNRLVDDIQRVLTEDAAASSRGAAALEEWKLAAGAEGWNGERLFQAARFVTEMEYQHLAFEEFARKVQPLVEPFSGYHDDVDPAITAEFAHAVYRFGHSMLTDTISRTNADGSANDISLLDGFLNPLAYDDGGTAGDLDSHQAAGAIAMGMSNQVGNELDEFVTDTLRSNLLGLPLDLAAINLARARETGVPSLNNLRKQLHGSTNDSQLAPYKSWTDFGLNIKHPESLVNFVAAYGTHETITSKTALADKRAAAQLLVDPPIGTPAESIPADAEDFMTASGTWAAKATGLDEVDLWIGGLAERTNLFGGLLGSTFNYVFEKQMTDLQNGDRFYYLVRTPGMNLFSQLEGNSFAEMIMRNTTAHSMTADAFSTADCKFQLGNLAGTGSSVADDAGSECNETELLIRMPDGTIRYRTTNSVDPAGINGQSVFNGTDATDRSWGGVDNDTFWGGPGNDRIEGNDGADTALGGVGNDIITDMAGDDVHKGGPGNDAIDSGPGLDIVLGGDGHDLQNGGLNTNEHFAGNGDDLIIAGSGADTVFADSGDDWIEGGDGADLLQGDSGAPFFDDPNKPGHDVISGQNGDDDYDAEGGDDIMLAGPGIERNAGAAGFDWTSYQLDPIAADSDLDLRLLGVPLPVDVLRDRHGEVEASSGGAKNDILRGDSIVPRLAVAEGASGSNWLDEAGVNRIAGLRQLLPTGAATGDSVWGEGNIILGGAGSDTLEGRGADDILDGDKYLNVRLSVRTDRNDAATEIGSATSLSKPYLAGSTETLQQAVFAGKVDPGNIVVVREILDGGASGGTDVAVFSDIQANYTVTTTPAGAALGAPGSVTTVTHNDGGDAGDDGAVTGDGTDTLRNVEKLIFADTQAPAAPTAVTATGANASAIVTWSAPAGSSITGFDVLVADAQGNQVGLLRPADAAATSLLVDGLANGTAYRFQVRAVNEVGPGPYSALSAAVTPAPVAPGAPAIASVTGGDLQATVNWTAPADNGGSALTGFAVRVIDAANNQVGDLHTAAAGATSLVVTDLPAGSPVRFQVAAVNGIGQGTFSAASDAVTPVETVAPSISDRTPAAAATGVRRDSNIAVTFNEPVSGISGTTLVLRNAATEEIVEATVSYDQTTMTALLDPAADLRGGTQYRVTVSGGAAAVRDTFDNALGSDSWTFTTENGLAKTVDFTGDGDADVVARDGQGRLWLYPGNGTGGLDARTLMGRSGWNAMSAITSTGDFDGDGTADVIAKDRVGTGQLWLYPGNGTGGLEPRVLLGRSGWNAMNTLFSGGDMNGDGDTDLMARDGNGRLWTYPGTGAGRLQARILTGSSGWNSITSLLSAGDSDGDGTTDVLARTSDGRLWLYPGAGNARLGSRSQMGTGWNTMRAIFSPGDLSGDGTSDVVASHSDGRLLLYPGNGTGGLQAGRVIGTSGWTAMSILF